MMGQFLLDGMEVDDNGSLDPRDDTKLYTELQLLNSYIFFEIEPTSYILRVDNANNSSTSKQKFANTATNSQSFSTIIGNHKILVTLFSIYNDKTTIPTKEDRKGKGDFNKLCEDNNKEGEVHMTWEYPTNNFISSKCQRIQMMGP